MKVLLFFDKGEAVRWLGHLDILRTFERAVRRAELPIAFTAGFNPRERIVFASALSVGVTGAMEPATLELTAWMDPDEVSTRLNSKLPPGIQIRACASLPETAPRDYLNRFHSAELHVVCRVEPTPTMADVTRATTALLQRETIELVREKDGKRKTVNIRPLVRSIDVHAMVDGQITLNMVLSLGSEGTAKPAEIVALLAADLPSLTVRRVNRMRLLDNSLERPTESLNSLEPVQSPVSITPQ